jgi:hypothetical protein
MATTPIAYNAGSAISGTIQVGNLAVGTSSLDYSSNPGGVVWWMGPDDSTGYVIAEPISEGNQPTNVTTNRVYLSPIYKGTDIVLSNNNQTAAQIFGYEMSVLGTGSIGINDKVMFSVLCTLADPGASPNSHFVGIGTTAMNYNSNGGDPYIGFPGNDNHSVGFNSGGEIWFNGSDIDDGFGNWGDGDIIDVAVDNYAQKLWVRINGEFWNGNISGNPATNTLGIDISNISGTIYPVLCPGYQGTMTIQNAPVHNIPSGFSFLATLASVGFYQSSAKTDNSFTSLVNNVFSQNFSNASSASNWLTSNGYWNSYSASSSTTSQFSVNIFQTGSDVVWLGSGSFDLTYLTLSGSSNIGAGYQSNMAIWAIGPNVTTDVYQGTITYPASFGTGGTPVTSTSGSTFGVLPGGSGRTLYLPSGYISNTVISGSATYVGQTISGMGLNTGSYVWTWGSGSVTSSLTMTIG